MKRYRYAACAVALGVIALAPAIVQAATPLDLEFHSYRGNKTRGRDGNPPVQLMGTQDVDGHSMRYKLIYSE